MPTPEEQRVKKAQLEAGGAEVIRQSSQRGGGDRENTSKNHHPGRTCVFAAKFSAPLGCFCHGLTIPIQGREAIGSAVESYAPSRRAQPRFRPRSSEPSPGWLLGSGQPPRGRGLQRLGASESSSKPRRAWEALRRTRERFCLTVRLLFTRTGASLLGLLAFYCFSP